MKPETGHVDVLISNQNYSLSLNLSRHGTQQEKPVSDVQLLLVCMLDFHCDRLTTSVQYKSISLPGLENVASEHDQGSNYVYSKTHL